MDYSALKSKNPKDKYACSKEIIRIARASPKKLVKDYDFFVKLLDSENNILKWTALDAIGGIVSITCSSNGVNLLISYLNKGNMITAGHAMDALKQVASARHELKQRIINELLKVPDYKYATVECNKVLYSRLIATLEQLGADSKRIELFLEKQKKEQQAGN
ncbi:MAG: hypothetical protein JW791_04930 [Nanoarchaeota archaeon]|nr:hypothetical protein [Nanoarchaeota archaeon]